MTNKGIRGAAILALLGLGLISRPAPTAGMEMPEFSGISDWLNTPKPIAKSGLKGKVVLVAFWTHGCGNCIHTLPVVNHWYKKYRGRGLEIIGVHSPEFDHEKRLKNVQAAVRKHAIAYPVAIDNDFATWNSYSNRYWPAHYFVDRRGTIRYSHFGEGNYETSEAWIQKLLSERANE